MDGGLSGLHQRIVGWITLQIGSWYMRKRAQGAGPEGRRGRRGGRRRGARAGRLGAPSGAAGGFRPSDAYAAALWPLPIRTPAPRAIRPCWPSAARGGPSWPRRSCAAGWRTPSAASPSSSRPSTTRGRCAPTWRSARRRDAALAGVVAQAAAATRAAREALDREIAARAAAESALHAERAAREAAELAVSAERAARDAATNALTAERARVTPRFGPAPRARDRRRVWAAPRRTHPLPRRMP